MVYLINSPDVRFLKHEDKIFIQAKLISSPDDDRNGNGDGYVVTKMQLFNVTKGEKGQNKKSLEPKDREEVVFHLSQSFL